MREKISGIYQIKNKLNNKTYIGSSSNIYKRWVTHKRQLKNNCHHSIYLQRSFNKNTLDDYEFLILERCEKSALFERESYWIDSIHPEYNIGVVGGGDNLTNNPNKSEIINKISQSLKQRYSNMTQKEKEKFKKFGKDNPNWRGGTSKKYCQCGKLINPINYTCMKCRDKRGKYNPFYGKSHSEETKKKLAEKQQGRYNGNQEKKIKIGNTIYKSCADAARELNVSNGTITYRLKHKTKYLDYIYLD